MINLRWSRKILSYFRVCFYRRSGAGGIRVRPVILHTGDQIPAATDQTTVEYFLTCAKMNKK